MPCGTTSACAVGVCEDGYCVVMPESPLPYHFGRCDVWTADPPPNVNRFVFARGALWGAGDGGAHVSYVVRHEPGGWLISLDPRMATDLFDIDGSEDTVALRVGDPNGTGGSSLILRRDGAVWDDITDGLTLTQRLGELAVAGSSIYVIDDAGTVHRHDGVTWISLPAPPAPAPPDAIMAATATALYVGTRAGDLLRWDGTAWQNLHVPSALPTPPPITSVLAGDESSVFVNDVYRFDGTALVMTTGGSAVSAASGHVIGRDATGYAEWIGGAWSHLVLPTVESPVWADALEITALPDGYLLRNITHVLVHDSTGDHELWENGPMLVTPGSIATDVWAAGVTGLMQLAGDSWSTAAGTETLSPPAGSSTFRAPDGTLFVNSQIGATYGSEVSSYASGSLTSLLVFGAGPGDGTNNIRGFIGARSGTNVVLWRRIGLATWDGSTWGGPGQDRSSSFGFAIAGTDSAVARYMGQGLSVYDGSIWASTVPAPDTFVGAATNIGDPLRPNVLITDRADEAGTGYHVFSGSDWTAGVFPPGVAVRYAIGPTIDEVVAVGDQAGSRGLAWFDASGAWRFSSAHGTGGTPVATDGASVVWSNLFLGGVVISNGEHGGTAVSRCALDR